MQYSENELKTDKSSWILLFKYDDDAEILTMYLRDGCIYEYVNISEELFECLVDAPSSGKFFNEHIAGNYVSTKIQ